MARVIKRIEKVKDGTEVTLRSPVLTDAEEYVNYCKSLFLTSEYVITQADEYEADIEKQKKWIEAFDDKLCSIAIIAEIEGKIVGNINFKGHEDRRRIIHRGAFGLGIIEKWRGKGLGKLLVKSLIAWAKSSDNPIEKIELIVMAANEPAVKLYTSLGFKEEGRIHKEIKISENKYIDGIMMGLWVK